MSFSTLKTVKRIHTHLDSRPMCSPRYVYNKRVLYKESTNEYKATLCIGIRRGQTLSQIARRQKHSGFRAVKVVTRPFDACEWNFKLPPKPGSCRGHRWLYLRPVRPRSSRPDWHVHFEHGRQEKKSIKRNPQEKHSKGQVEMEGGGGEAINKAR